MKRAKLVTLDIMVRVIVEHDATEDEILEAARLKARDTIMHDSLADHLLDIRDDTEVPFGTIPQDYSQNNLEL